MIYVEKCVLCGSLEIHRFPAKLNPFIANRAGLDEDTLTELIKCSQCDFKFYNPRLDEVEINRLYEGYRGAEYQVQRQKYEPWYTPEINDLIGKNEIELKQRKDNLRELLSRNTDIAGIESVLDFGGDRGQFILDELVNAKKYVYEISKVLPLDGIEVITEIDDSARYDLVMCCHVLEHYSYPRELLEVLVPLIGANGFLYIELPADDPTRTGKRTGLKHFLNGLIDVLPNFARLGLKLFGKTSGTMHEHINHFSLESVDCLLNQHGLVVVEKYEKIINCGWIKGKIICFLAKAKL